MATTGLGVNLGRCEHLLREVRQPAPPAAIGVVGLEAKYRLGLRASDQYTEPVLCDR